MIGARRRSGTVAVGAELADGVQVVSGLARGRARGRRSARPASPPASPVEIQDAPGSGAVGRHVPERPLHQAARLRHHDDGGAGRAGHRLLPPAQGRPVPGRRVPDRHRDHRLPGRLAGDGGARGHPADRGEHQHRRGRASTSSPPRRKGCRTSSSSSTWRSPRRSPPRTSAARWRRSAASCRARSRSRSSSASTPGAIPIVSVAVNAPGLSPQAATDLADKLVKRRLENVPGVGAVNLVGESRRARSRWWWTARGSRRTTCRWPTW